MGNLLLRLLGVAVCVVAAVLIYLEGGDANEALSMPSPTEAAPAASAPPAGLHAVRFFFGGGGKQRRVAGVVHGVALEQIIALGAPPGSLVASGDGDGVRFAFPSPAAGLVGFAVVTAPRPLRWEWTLDDAPWPRDAVFAGPYGLTAPDLLNGMGASCAHGFAAGHGTPYFSAHQIGGFVICEDR